jgi:hypothetical protein
MPPRTLLRNEVVGASALGEPVSVDTRIFVWQRDGGSCRKCGSPRHRRSLLRHRRFSATGIENIRHRAPEPAPSSAAAQTTNVSVIPTRRCRPQFHYRRGPESGRSLDSGSRPRGEACSPRRSALLSGPSSLPGRLMKAGSGGGGGPELLPGLVDHPERTPGWCLVWWRTPWKLAARHHRSANSASTTGPPKGDRVSDRSV